MDWKEYEEIRDDIITRIKRGQQLHQVQPIGRIHSKLFNHDLFYPSCSTTLMEMVIEIEKKYKIKDQQF